MAFSVVAVLPWFVSAVGFTLISLTAIITTCLAAAASCGVPRQYLLTFSAGVSALAIWLEPIHDTLTLGQVNAVLMCAVAEDCLLPDKVRPRWLPPGLLVGVAASLKLIPGIFILFFLASRAWNPAVTAAGTFVIVSGLGWIFAPANSRVYWLDQLWHPNGMANIQYLSNQSIRGVLARSGLPAEGQWIIWCAGAVLVLAGAWIGARGAASRGEYVGALAPVAAAGLLLSPVSWSNHWVWVAPGLMILVGKARKTRAYWVRTATAIALVVFAVGPHWLFVDDVDRGVGLAAWQWLIANAYVWVAVAVLLTGVALAHPIHAMGLGARVRMCRRAARSSR